MIIKPKESFLGYRKYLADIGDPAAEDVRGHADGELLLVLDGLAASTINLNNEKIKRLEKIFLVSRHSYWNISVLGDSPE